MQHALSPLRPGTARTRALFPITEHTNFLNHASASPLSTRVVAAMQEWLALWQAYGGRDDTPQPLEVYRATLARVVGASADEIAIVQNTSDGLLLVAQGFPFRPGDALLTTEGEFTANVYPWRALQERGVEIIRLPARENYILPEDIEGAMRANPRVRLLAISFVHFATGFRNDLRALASLCRRYDVALCVDAIQGAGALPIDVNEMEIDFLAAGGPKWLMGPIGAGFFYCRREWITELQPGRHGWLSTSDVGDYFRYDAPLLASAARFEAGTLPWASLTGLVASVETLLEVGIPRIAEHVLMLGDALAGRLQERGYCLAVPDPAFRGPTLAFRDPRRPSQEIARLLDEEHITVSARGPWVRVSPHFYNNLDDIEALVQCL